MLRILTVLIPLFVSASAFAQTSVPASDPLAVSLAQQSVAAITGGMAIKDVTLNGLAISILGSDAERGTAKLMVVSPDQSRVDLTLSATTRSDVRSLANGIPTGEWTLNGTQNAYAVHNCWTDPSWFFPGLSYLTQAANPNFVFKYLGSEKYVNVSVQHLRIFQVSPADSSSTLRSPSLSTTDFYLDATSFLPVSMAFKVHADNDINTDIPVEVRFQEYQIVDGVQIPFHIQRIYNGAIALDIAVTSSLLNSNPSAALFQTR